MSYILLRSRIMQWFPLISIFQLINVNAHINIFIQFFIPYNPNLTSIKRHVLALVMWNNVKTGRRHAWQAARYPPLCIALVGDGQGQDRNHWSSPVGKVDLGREA